MRISEIAQASGLTVKSVRYYESVGLIPAPERAENGYRSYNKAILTTLKLIKNARLAGFSVEECKELVALRCNAKRKSADVHELVCQKVAAIDEQLLQLQKVRSYLVDLADSCGNDGSAACAILDTLTTEQS